MRHFIIVILPPLTRRFKFYDFLEIYSIITSQNGKTLRLKAISSRLNLNGTTSERVIKFVLDPTRVYTSECAISIAIRQKLKINILYICCYFWFHCLSCDTFSIGSRESINCYIFVIIFIAFGARQSVIEKFASFDILLRPNHFLHR